MTKFDELKERFPNLIPVQELRSNVSIIELALQHGYEPQLHKGKSRPVLEHPGYQDTIIIKNPQDPAQQVYQRAGDFTDAGTIIDFIRNRLSTVFSTFNRPGEHEFKNITSVLYDYLRVDPNHVSQNRKAAVKLAEPVVKQPFTKEQFDIRPLEPENYLNKRHLAPETLSRPEFAGKVITQITYFDPKAGHAESFLIAKEHAEHNYLKFSNVAFPYYNGQSTEVTGLELRNEKVKLHAPGSDRYSSVFVSNPPAKTDQFFIMESAIDALSHRQLRSIQGDTRFDSVYFSTGGQLTPQQINTVSRYIGSFEKGDNWQLSLGFDNDAKGHRYDLQFIQQMAAVKFPMSPTVAGANRIAYLLPEQEAYRPIRDMLLDRVENFNKDVQAQFVRSQADSLGQKELTGQLITVGRAGQQIQISIPESCAALSAVNKLLLDATGMSHRIRIGKAEGKDFNLDLEREVKLGEKFRYTIADETGKLVLNSDSAINGARTMQQKRHQGEGEGANKTFTLSERQAYGFQRPHVVVKLEEGVCIKSTQTTEFSQQLTAEKQQHQQPGERRQEKQALNPENKPLIGQLPKEGVKPRQIKPRHG